MPKRNLIIAIPKGRILSELDPLFKKINLIPELEFYAEDTRKLIFSCNISNLKLIKVRSFDVATLVKFGAADLGICGLDVLEEFSSEDIYRIFNLGIGKCRLAIAGKVKNSSKESLLEKSHLRIATKYLGLTHNYFSSIGIQAECVKLNGSLELAPHLGLCDFIVDLVSSGKTLKENNLSEIVKILDVSSYLIANRNSFKIKNLEIAKIIRLFDLDKLIRRNRED